MLFSEKSRQSLQSDRSVESVGVLMLEAGRIDAKTALLRRAGMTSHLWELVEIPLRFVRPALIEELSQRGERSRLLHPEGLSVFYEPAGHMAVVLVSDAQDGSTRGRQEKELLQPSQSFRVLATELERVESALDVVIHRCRRVVPSFVVVHASCGYVMPSVP